MNSPVAIPSTVQQSKTLLGLLFFGFVPTGIATVILGPVLPGFISRWSLSDSQAGLFFTVQFMSSLVATVISSAINSRYGYRFSLIAGYLLLGTGFATLNTGSHSLALLAIAALGLGYGFVVPGTNLSVAETAGRRSASLLNLLNFAWGAGAVACSPLILFSLRQHLFVVTLIILTALNCALATLFGFADFSGHAKAEPAVSETRSLSPFTWGFALILALLFFTYVGVETSIGGWAAEHVKRLNGSSGLATIAPMFFYAGLMSGRALAPIVLLRTREYSMVMAALSLVFLGILVTILARHTALALASLVVAGLGCSTIYPICVAWFSRWYRARAKQLGALMFSTASIGAAVVPWLVGMVSRQAGSLRIGLFVPLSGAAAMLIIVVALRRQASEQ